MKLRFTSVVDVFEAWPVLASIIKTKFADEEMAPPYSSKGY